MKYRICTNCIMDTSDPFIQFDDKGICNHCYKYWNDVKKYVVKGSAGEKKIEEIVTEIKKRAQNKKYDCIIGLSGGVDSSYLLYLLTKFKLNPLAVHFDNGWNTEQATENIKQLTSRLNIDLYTYVIDWELFKDLQLSYLKASVIDIDVPTDQLIFASLYKIAKQFRIKSLIIGGNVVTESVLPYAWYFRRKFDQKNMYAIHKKYGTKKITKFPKLGKWHRLYYNHIYRLKSYSILNYVNYNKIEAKKHLINNLGWKDYGGKHYENIFTRFYQGYILPYKFGIDKRRAHLSNMVLSNMITREDALNEIEQNDYTEQLIKQDKKFFLKKLSITNAEFDEIMKTPIQAHENFPIELPFYDSYPIFKFLKPIGDWLKKI